MADYQIGFYIQQLRNAKGLTQHQLAELTGYSFSYMSKIEQGAKTPSFKAMKKIAKALDFRIESILAHMHEDLDSTKRSLLLELNYAASQTEHPEFIEQIIQMINTHNQILSGSGDE